MIPIGIVDNCHVDARQLEIFVAVAEERSFTRAARQLFAAQSTISAAVRTLEQELGGALFARSTRAVELTPAGEAALVEARATLASIERLRSAARPGDGELRGRVRFGVFSGMQVIDQPGLLGEFHRAHPLVNLRLEVSSAGSVGLLDDVRRRRLDVALVGLPAKDLAGLDIVLLGTTEYVAVLPSGHPLNTRHRLELVELADERFVDTLSGAANRDAIDRAFSDLGRPRTLVAEVADLPSVPDYVAAGLGIAVVPDVTPIGDGLVTVPLRGAPQFTLSAIAAPEHGAATAALLDLLATRAAPDGRLRRAGS